MKIWRYLFSIECCLWLLALVCSCMAAGSFVLTGEYAAAINAMPLFSWLREAPATVSWWLWLTVVLLGLLVVNTFLCSSETLWSRWRKGGIVPLLAPQLMHAGFLMIVAAHLVSAAGSSHSSVEAGEMSLVPLPDGRKIGVATILVRTTPQGMPIGFSSELVTDIARPAERVIVSPNHPWFSGGYGVYIKQAQEYPVKRVLLEIHREPGSSLALAGSLVFLAGNVLLLSIRSKYRE